VRLKDFIKRAGGAVCSTSLMAPLVRARARSSVNVAYYHFVGATGPHYDAFYVDCTIERFTKDLEGLSRVFEFAPLSEVIANGQSNGGSSKKPKIAITFDDGLDLRRTGIMEVASRFGAQVTTFVITSCIDNQDLMWQHKLSAIQSLAKKDTCLAEYNRMAKREGFAPIESIGEMMDASTGWDTRAKDRLAAELWEGCHLPPVSEYLAAHKPYFGWDGLRAWLAAGHSVGFHTHSHPYCERLQREEVATELIEPAISLKEKLGLKELCFAYPFGSRLPRVLEDELFSKDIFKAIFGIKGFKKRGAPNHRLERAAMEKDGVGWPVFAQLALRDLRSSK
jgi:peptidoglycan/xylan/chitin deacetylase (PgdA/CDA1 family)